MLPGGLQPALTQAASQLANAQLEQISITSMQTATGIANIVQIGPGNVVSLNPAQLGSGIMNVIQNSLDNQSIRQNTTIQLSANSLTLVRAASFGSQLQRQILGSIR